MKQLFALAIVGLLAACPAGKTTGPAGPTPPAVNPTPPVVDAPLSAATLGDFMKQRFPAAVAAGTIVLDYGDAQVGNDVVEELSLLGITTTTQFAAIVPPDFDTRGLGAITRSSAPTTNIAGLVRDLLIIHDVNAYFEKAWRDGWTSNGPEDFPAPAAYGVDMEVMRSYGAFGGGNPCGGGYDDDPCGGGYDEDPCGGDEYDNPCGG